MVLLAAMTVLCPAAQAANKKKSPPKAAAAAGARLIHIVGKVEVESGARKADAAEGQPGCDSAFSASDAAGESDDLHRVGKAIPSCAVRHPSTIADKSRGRSGLGSLSIAL